MMQFSEPSTHDILKLYFKVAIGSWASHNSGMLLGGGRKSEPVNRHLNGRRRIHVEKIFQDGGDIA